MIDLQPLFLHISGVPYIPLHDHYQCIKLQATPRDTSITWVIQSTVYHVILCPVESTQCGPGIMRQQHTLPGLQASLIQYQWRNQRATYMATISRLHSSVLCSVYLPLEYLTTALLLNMNLNRVLVALQQVLYYSTPHHCTDKACMLPRSNTLGPSLRKHINANYIN